MANIVMEFALIPASVRPKMLAISDEMRELAKLSILCADCRMGALWVFKARYNHDTGGSID